ncbi:hypothetical protein, partial [Rhizobium leguminosarum]|uniref:hypothetical protein n=1 Tax=Rhizobium leguminosarum TaxID=384 RepID=UPI003F9D0496
VLFCQKFYSQSMKTTVVSSRTLKFGELNHGGFFENFKIWAYENHHGFFGNFKIPRVKPWWFTTKHRL